MTSNDLYELYQYCLNKFQGSGYLTPDEFNQNINAGSIEFQSYLIGQIQQYQYGRAQPRVNYSQNESIRQKLTPFIDEPRTLTIDAQGRSPYPSDYVQTDAMYQNSIYMDRVRYASQDRLFSFLNDPIDPVATNPVYSIESIYFRFFPQTLGTAKLSYVRKPNEIVWGYTNSIYGQPVYDPTSSVNPEWADIDIFEVLARALKLSGVSLQASQVYQYANELSEKGQ